MSVCCIQTKMYIFYRPITINGHFLYNQYIFVSIHFCICFKPCYIQHHATTNMLQKRFLGTNIQPVSTMFKLDRQEGWLWSSLFKHYCTGCFFYRIPHGQMFLTGPSCSKLMTSLVNDSLKFTSSDTQMC